MPALSWIVWLIPAFPLIGFLLNVFVIRRERQSGIVASAAVVLAFVTTLVAVGMLQSMPDSPEQPRRITSVLWEWISIGAFRVPFGVLFDQLTAVMTLLVTGVGAIIHIYSIGYMRGDVRPVRYFAYMNLFIFTMLMLVMADNMLLLFLGWEGVGLSSFLLIGHWFDRRSVQPGLVPSDAATKAFYVNRIGDAGMLLAIMAIFSRFGSVSFYSNQSLPGYLERADQLSFAQVDLGALGTIGVVTAITFLLLIGAAGKSAQAPLFVWLPDAMAGPTPVSALIHAATMVTSGVYMIARNHTLFEASPSTSGWVVGIGMLTAFIAATAAVTQFDIKRVLAYSTISQLGYMIVAVGMGAYVAAMFHLLTHGVFKALLFLGSGSIIHGAHGNQDMRKMGGLRESMPITFWTYVVGAAALGGIFPLAGFWSKDEIIAHAWFDAQNPGLALILIVTSALTAFYMGRQVALIFYGKQRDTSYHAHESEPIIRWPLVVLAVGAIIAGIINLPGLHWLNDYLKPTLNEEATLYTFGKGALAVITTLIAAGSGYLGWYLYGTVLPNRIKVGKDDPALHYLGDLWRGSEMGWGFDWLYQRGIVRPYREISVFLSDVFDRQGIDETLVDGSARLVGWLSQSIRGAQSGFVRNYALMFLIGVVILVGYFTFRA